MRHGFRNKTFFRNFEVATIFSGIWRQTHHIVSVNCVDALVLMVPITVQKLGVDPGREVFRREEVVFGELHKHSEERYDIKTSDTKINALPTGVELLVFELLFRGQIALHHR